MFSCIFGFYSPSFLLLIIVAFVVNIEVVVCQCVYYLSIIPLGILSVSALRVALGQLSCYKLLAKVFGVYSVYGANLPFTTL